MDNQQKEKNLLYDENELDNYLEVALKAADQGAEIVKGYWGQFLDEENKGIIGNLVTKADCDSERKIIEILTANFPLHSILAEESGMHSTKASPFLWAIDPLDGTTNFAHQFPLIAVSVALLFQGKPLVGVVHNPIMNELFYGVRGRGAFLNDQPIATSQRTLLSECLLATGFPYNRKEIEDNNYREFCHLTDHTQGVRRGGCASLDLAYVASGRLDGFWENYLNPWDIAAGALLVEEAGGTVTSYDKSPLNYFHPKILASNGNVHHLISEKLVIQ